jgi:hypothetical protein
MGSGTLKDATYTWRKHTLRIRCHCCVAVMKVKHAQAVAETPGTCPARQTTEAKVQKQQRAPLLEEDVSERVDNLSLVGVGKPSPLNTWPRWPPQLLHTISVLRPSASGTSLLSCAPNARHTKRPSYQTPVIPNARHTKRPSYQTPVIPCFTYLLLCLHSNCTVVCRLPVSCIRLSRSKVGQSMRCPRCKLDLGRMPSLSTPSNIQTLHNFVGNSCRYSMWASKRSRGHEKPTHKHGVMAVTTSVRASEQVSKCLHFQSDASIFAVQGRSEGFVRLGWCAA